MFDLSNDPEHDLIHCFSYLNTCVNYYEVQRRRQNKQVNYKYTEEVGHRHVNCEEFQLQCTANRAFSVDLFSLWPSFVVQKLTDAERMEKR